MIVPKPTFYSVSIKKAIDLWLRHSVEHFAREVLFLILDGGQVRKFLAYKFHAGNFRLDEFQPAITGRKWLPSLNSLPHRVKTLKLVSPLVTTRASIQPCHFAKSFELQKDKTDIPLVHFSINDSARVVAKMLLRYVGNCQCRGKLESVTFCQGQKER